MFKVQVQPSRKHKYHNNSTKKRGCSRDTSYLSRSPLRQHRTKPACRLCAASADEFSVISHRNSLQYASIPASFLCNLTKNLLAHLPHILCAVLPLLTFLSYTIFLVPAIGILHKFQRYIQAVCHVWCCLEQKAVCRISCDSALRPGLRRRTFPAAVAFRSCRWDSGAPAQR